jgi:Ca2+-binding RTX toxin-like protein
MATLDFGNFEGIDMRNSGALGADIFADFPTFNFLDGALEGVTLEIPNSDDPAFTTAFVRAYSSNWQFEMDGSPAPGTVVYALEVWVPGASPGDFAYRIVIDNIAVNWSSVENALVARNLSTLYANQSLTVLGSQTFDDTLVGSSFTDALYGYGGNDVLIANAGNDYLDGDFNAPAGADTMTGGQGDDDYVVNHVDDEVVETSGQGIDLVVSSIDYTLPTHVDDLTLLTAGGAIDGIGNTLANFMAGNASDNRLQGVDGNDTLLGFDGNDILEGGAGTDRLEGGNGADRLRGGDGNDSLLWHAADAKVDGGAGVDTLRVISSLNFTVVNNAKILGIERVNLIGNGANTITINAADVLDLSTTSNAVRVLGEAADTVRLSGVFTELGEVDGYTRYQRGAATLWIDSDVTVVQL